MTLELDVKKHVVELQNKKKIKLSESKLLNLSSIFTFIAFKSTNLNVTSCYGFWKRYRVTQHTQTRTCRFCAVSYCGYHHEKKPLLNEAMQFGFQYIKLENSNHESNCRKQISSKYRIQIVSSLKRLMLIKYTW